MGGEEHDGRSGHAVTDAAGGSDAVDVPHPHIHQDDGGAAALGEHHGGFAITGLAYDADIRLAREGHAQPFTNDLVVVCDEAGDGLIGVHGHGAATPQGGLFGALSSFGYRQQPSNR
jgi:hypothetical protein